MARYPSDNWACGRVKTQSARKSIAGIKYLQSIMMVKGVIGTQVYSPLALPPSQTLTWRNLEY